MAAIATNGGSGRRNPKTLVLLAVWGGCIVVAIVLQAAAPGFMAFRGVAQLVEYHPSARLTERVLEITADVGVQVKAGDVVARLDPHETQDQIDVLKAQLAQAEAELASQRVQVPRRNNFEQRRFVNAVADAQVSLVAARNKRETERAELTSVQGRIKWWQPMVEARAASGQTLEELREAAKVLERQVAIEADAIKTWQNVLDLSRARLAAFRAAAPDEDEGRAVEAGLGPYVAAVEVLKARVAEMQERLDALTLRTPGDGVVYKVEVRPGDVATPGAPVLQIRAPTTKLVLAYVSDVVASMIGPGTKAEVTPRDAAGRLLAGKVLAIGSGVRPLPDQALANPNWHEFGEEVAVELDEAGWLAPGQVVDVRFELGTGSRLTPVPP